MFVAQGPEPCEAQPEGVIQNLCLLPVNDAQTKTRSTTYSDPSSVKLVTSSRGVNKKR